MHHQDHDSLLIAGLAADDLTPDERQRAQALVDDCTECRALRDDLLAIARATSSLPGPSAPRDFRITAEQAARLRRSSWLGRLLGPFGSRRSVARPIAATFTTLGLVGVLATSLGGFMGGAASAARPEAAGGPSAPGPLAASAAPGAQFGPLASAAALPGDSVYGVKDNVEASGDLSVAQGGNGGGTGSGGEYGNTGGGDRDAGAGTDDGRLNAALSPTNLLLFGSLGLLGTGLAMFGLVLAGRRLR